MKKKLVALALLLALFAGFLPWREAGLTAVHAAESPFDIEDGRLIRYTGSSSSVTVPSSVRIVCFHAFAFNNNVTDITLGSSVSQIEEDAFVCCDHLRSVKMPGHMSSIGFGAFAFCPMLEEVTLPYGITDIYFETFYNDTGLKKVFIPSTVATIEGHTFAFCENLTEVTLPSALRSVGQFAFWNCRSLPSINIPAALTEIDSTAFLDCKSLRAFRVAEGNPCFCDEDGVLYDREKTRLVMFPAGKGGDCVLPETVESIGNYAFYECEHLTTLTIPASVTSLGDGLFYHCNSLTDIRFGGTREQWDAMVADEEGNPRNLGMPEQTVLHCADDEPPVITKQPVNAFGAVNDTVTFAVEAEGQELTYQWYYKKAGQEGFTAWNKKTSPTVATPVYLSWHLAQFYCVVTDRFGQSVTSDTVTLHVIPRITVQPEDTSGNVGDTVKFSVKATGANLLYQWYYRKAGEETFTAWNKKTSATVSTPVYASWHHAQCYCLVKGGGKSVRSDIVTLAVLPEIVRQPEDASGAVNDNVTFTVRATGAGISYQWYFKKTTDSAFTAWNRKTTASVSTPVYASWRNARFYCVVKDADGHSLPSDTVTLTVTPTITVQPEDASGAVGDTVNFTVKATGNGLTYQWYFKKTTDSAFTPWNKKTSASVSTPVYRSWNGAQFYCVVKDSSGKTQQSNAATLTVK